MNYPSLLDQAHFAVVARPGHSVSELPDQLPRLLDRMVPPRRPHKGRDTLIFLIEAATADVSSTAIRRRCAEGLSIQGLVDPRVEQHIEQHGLYAPVPVEPGGSRLTPE
jgi:nicotinic acid mononucleotide adenylyltransferase